MKHRALVAVAAVVGSLAAAVPATACTCARNPDAPPEGSREAIRSDLDSTDSVFVGRVIGMQTRLRLYLRAARYLYLTRGDREISDEEEDRILRRRVRLRVEQSFKGSGETRLSLDTGWGGGDCGFEFRRGVSYLVYASHHDDRLSTGICYPTKALADAAAEVAVLAELVRPAPEVRDDAPVVAGLDHVPVAVADLEAAAARYRRLGFTLKPGRPHDNGIENRHVKFADGTEIELITAPEARDSLTAEYVRHLANGDGPAFLALYAPDLDRLARRFDAAPRAYRRSSRGTISFPDEDPLGYVFFGPRNASPTDLPAHFEHANGADSLIAVWLAGDDLSAEREMLAQAGASLVEVEVRLPDAVRATVARLEEGEVVLLPGSHQLVSGRRIVGATLRTRSLSAAQDALREGGLEVPAPVSTEGGTSIFLPPDVTHGIWLELREPRPSVPRAPAHGRTSERGQRLAGGPAFLGDCCNRRGGSATALGTPL